jgi:dienelactone hydrolase
MKLTRREMLALTGAACLPRFEVSAAENDPTRIFQEGEKPKDYRLGAPKTLNDYFPFTTPKTLIEWETRKQRVREQVLVANGLWPLPERTPLNATIHGKIVKPDYTIEKVFFSSTPGHYVCGNLYRPNSTNLEVKYPAVLFAHGHWANGRMHDAGENAAEASVKSGAEADLARGRYFMQAIPATLARLGFVVFQYDMIGYADSTAIKHISKSGVPHPEGFADAEGELRLQSLMGLQTWNSIRCLDFLETLLDVDHKRFAITGASGGGTQTFMLTAVDDRVAAAFPAVMVSTAMQGGCVCENCSLLRVGTGNVELAGLFAPKPMAMSGANDWTKEIMTKGYPQLQQLYRLYGKGAEKKVMAKAWLGFGHNYNQHSREMMYEWFNEHLHDNTKTVREPSYEPVPPAELSVFDEAHPRPKDELGAKELRKVMSEASDKQIAALMPKNADTLAEFQSVMRGALRAILSDELSGSFDTPDEREPIEMPGKVKMFKYSIKRNDPKEALPVCILSGEKSGDRVTVWLHPQGKSSLFTGGLLKPEALALLEAGHLIYAPDLLGTGELAFEKPYDVNQVYAGFTFGYNRSLLAQRVHDVLNLLAFFTTTNVNSVSLIGWEEFGPIAVLAVAATQGKLNLRKVAVDLNQFRFENITKTDDPMMLPGAVKYGGLPAFLAMCAPSEVLAHNHKGTATGKLPKAAYEAAGANAKLVRKEEKLLPAQVIEWLVK